MNADSSRPEPGPISQDLIKETLRTLEVRYLIDGDGDVITLWPDSCMCFLTAGTRSTIYVHRVHLDRRFALDGMCPPAQAAGHMPWHRTVTIAAVQYDSPGRDDGSNRSLNREWVEVANNTGRVVVSTVT